MHFSCEWLGTLSFQQYCVTAQAPAKSSVGQVDMGQSVCACVYIYCIYIYNYILISTVMSIPNRERE